uniref:Uncharacterized protein n=1 Tax=Solanum lycopersicum TaxID=4081 RepID=K4BS83_SOLLC
MAGAVAVNHAPTQSINMIMEFLLIFLSDIPKHYIHGEKLDDMLTHVGVLTMKISILVSKLMEETFENNINETDFSDPYLLDSALTHLIFSLPSVTDKIKLIVEEITSLQLHDENGDDNPLDAKSSDESIESTSSSFVEVTVGHEEDEACTIDQLLDKHESKLDVISIVEMPGFSKITLANKVYKNTLVASHFNVCAWCTISQKFIKSKVLQVILQQVAGSEDNKESNEGDKVVDLAEKLVFGDQGRCSSELSEFGHQIVERCQGLPLAVILIAGVIVRGKKKEKDLWLKIQHNMDSLISANNNLQIMKVMQLSYDHLPHHLKLLLFYFERSQKNKRTPLSKLMQLWMAEEFVDHCIPYKSSLEDNSNYLEALIYSSLVMVDPSVSKSSHRFSVAIKVCYVHDVVHDFCSVIAKKEIFFKLINSGAPFFILWIQYTIV